MTDLVTFAKDVLVLIGFLWLGTQATKIMRWYFFTNRDGNSGRSSHHWSRE